jgi:hypothetical protein
MSAAPKQLDFSPPPIIKRVGQRALIVGVVFGVGALALAFTRAEEFYRGYLLGYMDWLGIALGSMAIVMIRHLTGGGWGTVIRRILGAAMRTLPIMAILFIPIIVGVLNHQMYPWLKPLDAITNPHIREHLHKHEFIKGAYLNGTGFIIRAVIYLAIWNLLSFLLSMWSKQTDKPGAPDNTQKFKVVAGPGLILYAFTISFAVIDWLMSLDPSWISTIFGLIILAGELLSAICFAIVVERILVDYKPMSEMLRPEFVHDHGKWTLTFIMLWAYFSFSQWLIIWAGNLPAEITFYLKRINHGWGYIAVFLALFHFCVPFVILLSRPFKRDIRKLVWVGVWLLFMRFVDLFWIIEPNFSTNFAITIADIVVPIAIGSIWIFFFCRNLAALPLLPVYDVSAHDVFDPHSSHPPGIPENA